jgi:hypothetical protein
MNQTKIGGQDMTHKPEPQQRFHLTVDKKGKVAFSGKVTVNWKAVRRGFALVLMLAGLWMAGAGPETRSKLLDFWLRLIASLAG